MRYDEVKKWENTSVGDRGNEYLEFKNERTERFLNLIFQKFPELKDSIKSVYSSTPLTYRDYTGTVEGSMYGVLRDATKPLETMVSSRTKIPNLFLTGQNIKFHGVLGVTIGSIVTSSCFLGMNHIINKVKNA
jgi:all-trans-retinol 13,14-reductase